MPEFDLVLVGFPAEKNFLAAHDGRKINQPARQIFQKNPAALKFGEHASDTISIAPGEEVIEVSGAKVLTIAGAVRIMPATPPTNPAALALELAQILKEQEEKKT